VLSFSSVLGAQVKLTFLPSNGCFVGTTDATWLRHNLICVLGNAVKYAKGGIAVCVKLINTRAGPVLRRGSSVRSAVSRQEPSAREEHQLLEISVQDSGPGLSELELEHLFDAPVQHMRGQTGGMGACAIT